MEIVILKKEKSYLEIAIKGEDYSLPNALKEILLEDPKIEFAAFVMEHPQVADPVLVLRTKDGSALSALKSAVKKLKKMATDFKQAVKDAKKPKN